jgi:hypothetical protein
MKIKRTELRVLLAAVCVVGSAHAGDPDGPQKMLSIAKMAGACGIMDSMIQLQNTTKMQGGEAFVTRFWSVEAARLGMTVAQLSETCTKSIQAYDQLWRAVDTGAK